MYYMSRSECINYVYQAKTWTLQICVLSITVTITTPGMVLVNTTVAQTVKPLQMFTGC